MAAAGTTVTCSARFFSGFEAMRQLRVWVKEYEDVRLNEVGKSQIKDIESLFPPGLKVGVEFLPGPIQHGSVHITSAQLDSDLVNIQSGTRDPSMWNVWLLVAKSYGEHRFERARGVMFDETPDQKPREGCAVFVSQTGDMYEFLKRTAAHEVGHTLNLCHCDGKNAQHIMWDSNYNSSYGFSPLSNRHMETHDAATVEPGLLPFRDRRCAYQHGDCTNCSDPLSLPKVSSGKVALQLSFRRGRAFPNYHRVPRFVVGEPIDIRVRLFNGGRRSLSLRLSAGSTDGSLEILDVTEDTPEVMHAPTLACSLDDSAWRKLLPERGTAIRDRLAYRRGAPAFRFPGQYRLQARLYTKGRWIVSPERTIHIAEPENTRHELSVKLAVDPALAFEVEMGEIHSQSSRQKLQELESINPQFPLLKALLE